MLEGETMTAPELMTAEEIAAITGTSQPAAQVRVLRAMGIRAERNRLGQVVVLRAWLTQDCRQSQDGEPERSNSAAPLGVGWNEGLARSPEKGHNLGTKWKLLCNRRSPATAN